MAVAAQAALQGPPTSATTPLLTHDAAFKSPIHHTPGWYPVLPILHTTGEHAVCVHACPPRRPIGSGDRFCGVFHRPTQKVVTYERMGKGKVRQYLLQLEQAFKVSTQASSYQHSGARARGAQASS